MDEMTGEAGALDNRLTLSQDDHPEIADWEDGQEYHITGGTIVQVSPGEFQVTDLKFAEGGAPEAEGPTSEEEAGEAGKAYPSKGVMKKGSTGRKPGSHENPVIASLM